MRAAILFALVLTGHAYFAGDTSWNQNARLGAIYTFVEPGPDRWTLRIDGFARRDQREVQTGDWARGTDGHLYSNKPPGASMVGVPLYALLYAIESTAGADVKSAALTRINARLINVWAGPVWNAAASVVMFLFLVARGSTARAAALPPLAYAFATLILPFDTSLWGHTTAAACVLVAVSLVFWPPARTPHTGGDPVVDPMTVSERHRTIRRLLVAGCCAGFAVLIDYLAVFSLAAIGTAVIFRDRKWPQVAAFAAGAAGPILLLLSYQKIVFGGALTATVVTTNPVFVSAGHAWGAVGGIDAEALWRLLISPYRGLFVYCPALLFAAVGGWRRWRDGERALVGVCGFGTVATLLLVASFNGWWAGFSNGPRYLIGTIPLLVMLLPQMSELPVLERALYATTLVLSAANMAVIAAVDVMVAETDTNPLYGFTYSRFLAGQYPVSQWSTNAGIWLGLRPPFDVALFGLLVVVGLFLLWQPGRPPHSRPAREA